MQAELDRFCNAMIAIREEIKDIEEGRAEKYVHLSVKLPPAAMLSQTGADACPGNSSHSALLHKEVRSHMQEPESAATHFAWKLHL